MTEDSKWLEWATRLQTLAQNGLAYSKDEFDIERFQEIRQIAAEMLVTPSGMPLEKVKELFCEETVYKHLNWIHGQQFLKTIRFCSFKKKMDYGLCRADGVMWISL